MKTKKISKEDIEQKVKIIDTDLYEIEVYSDFFKRKVKIEIYRDHKGPIIISDYIELCVNNFIQYCGTGIHEFIEDIYQNYKSFILNCDYGADYQSYDWDFEKANQDYLGICINTKQDAFTSLKLVCIFISDFYGEFNRNSGYFSVIYDRPWAEGEWIYANFKGGKYFNIE